MQQGCLVDLNLISSMLRELHHQYDPNMVKDHMFEYEPAIGNQVLDIILDNNNNNLFYSGPPIFKCVPYYEIRTAQSRRSVEQRGRGPVTEPALRTVITNTRSEE